jgi:LmbE family N-acetylglucosaminyl deacetylase
MKLTVGNEVVMAIGDLHYPFAHTDHLEFLKAVQKLYKPTQIVCMGDEIDGAAISNYDPNPDGYSPGQTLCCVS